MSAVLHPVGPQSARVYWRRRLLVLLVLGALVAVAWSLLSGARGSAAETDPPADAVEEPAEPAGEPADDDAAAAAEADPAAEETAAEPAAEGPAACAVADLTVTLTSDARAYPVGTQPVLTVGVTNIGTTTCVVDTGTGRVVDVVSGSDRIWSSADCEEPAGQSLALLEPGARADTPVPWSRVRSAPGCPADQAEPRAGTYTATATLLGVTSAPTVFELG